MKLARTLRKIAAFFARDLAIARGYRGAFLLEALEALFGVATFYYLSRFVESPELTKELPAGSNYFAFALVGFAFFDYLSVSMTAFDASIEEARQNRTLEALLVTQTPLPVILAGSAVYPFTALALRTCVYLAWGELGRSRGDSPGVNSRVCRARNIIGQLFGSL
jgi:ABC-2 type transport system permease protein